MKDPEDLPGCQAIISSLEQRWSKADQEIFIAAVILNPIYQTSPFSLLPQFRTAEIISLMTRLWQRFFQSAPPDDFALDLMEFLGKRGNYSSLDVICNVEKNRAEKNVCDLHQNFNHLLLIITRILGGDSRTYEYLPGIHLSRKTRPPSGLVCRPPSNCLCKFGLL